MQTERKIEPLRKNRGLILFTALSISALMGVLFGTLCRCYIDGDISAQLSAAVSDFIELRKNGSFAAILLRSFAGTGIYVLAAYLLGFGAVSQPLQLFLPFIKGIGFGVILSQLYGSSFSKEALIRAAAVMPGVFFTLVIIILASRESMNMSSRIFRVCFQDRLFDGMRERTKRYSINMLTLTAATSVLAAVDCFTAILLLRRFL